MNDSRNVLTDYEISALPAEFNFTDGHARYRFIQSDIFEKLPDLLKGRLDQRQVEHEFATAYFGLGNQGQVNLERTLYCTSASISIEVIANYLRLHKMSVSLIEPAFDNLADILMRHKIHLEALAEEILPELGLAKWLETITTDALFLVIPNNPTGHTFVEAEFQSIIDFCLRKRKLLILDFSFRFFTQILSTWSQYELLERSGVDYIAFGDTGKTWMP